MNKISEYVKSASNRKLIIVGAIVVCIGLAIIGIATGHVPAEVTDSGR